MQLMGRFSLPPGAEVHVASGPHDRLASHWASLVSRFTFHEACHPGSYEGGIVPGKLTSPRPPFRWECLPLPGSGNQALRNVAVKNSRNRPTVISNLSMRRELMVARPSICAYIAPS